jgi:hypothetical protein
LPDLVFVHSEDNDQVTFENLGSQMMAVKVIRVQMFFLCGVVGFKEEQLVGDGLVVVE